MKLRKLVLTVLSLAITANFSTVYAEEGGATGRSDRAGSPRHKVHHLFDTLDTNEDGIITLDEYLVLATEKAAHQFDRIDTDDDELISLTEFLAGGNREDNSDVDRDEVRACIAAQTGEDVPERPDRETRFDALDTNDDGNIDADEFLAAKTDSATDKFNAIDADSDGGISKMELAQALKQHRQRRSVSRDCIENQRETDELLGG